MFQCEDPLHVRVTNQTQKQSILVPLPMAIRLWMKGISGGTGGGGTFAVLSFAFTSKRDSGIMLCTQTRFEPFPGPIGLGFVADHCDARLPWPCESWATGVPRPIWTTVDLGTWIPLPDSTTHVPSVLASSLKHLTTEEQTRASEIEKRCDAIRAQAADELYTDSLDYYTTCRVKHAFIAMNTAAIRSRTSEVLGLMRRIQYVLMTANDHVKDGWAYPDPWEVPSIDDIGNPTIPRKLSSGAE
jgi:hypothetical protein